MISELLIVSIENVIFYFTLQIGFVPTRTFNTDDVLCSFSRIFDTKILIMLVVASTPTLLACY
ncbi:MAG: hypothetical protein P6H82_00770 [Candidatus Arsenophonus melophagi]|nr:hypothetical protein [Candidatus Arsenophonus melophagi]